MKDYIYKYVLTLVAFLFASGATAQTDIEFDEDDSSAVADTLMPDTFKVTEQALPWNIAVAKHLDNLLQHDMFETSTVGMMVYDLDADSVLYSHNARLLLRPASTMKLVTAIAAIDRLGGSYQFKTELCYTGEVSDRTLTGDIYCVGGFDPRFNSDDMRAFVEAIHKMGVDTIRGNIYADKSMKDADQFGAGWCWDDDNPVLSPLLVSRKDEFVESFRKKLDRAGIVVDGSVRSCRTPGNARRICTVERAIGDVMIRMMKKSDNLYSESVFYHLAASSGSYAPATAKQGRQVMNRLIQQLGFKPSKYYIADGSGLSLYNYVSPELEVAFLKYAYKHKKIYEPLRELMPVAGVDGTLDDRMLRGYARGNVHAKTGTVTGVSALAGYCTAANGHVLCFSIINMGIRHSSSGRRFQDRVCEALCRP